MGTKTFDVIIIGGGVAGISAALWCDELGLTSVLLESKNELGGQLLWTYNAIENHLGINVKNGRQLRDIFVEQIEQRNFTFEYNAEIAKIDLENKYALLTNSEKFSARTIVIATGVRRRTLGLEGEIRFKERGILESGKRDKDLAKGKRVLIVGGGDAALENAQILSDNAAEIYVAHRRKEFRAREEFLKTANDEAKIKLLPETILKEIAGDKKIEAVTLENMRDNTTYSLPVDVVLFRIGVQPNTDFLSNKLELDKKGYIKINSICETNLEGIYAVGDVANPVSPTVSSAVGMGSTAIKAIYSRLQ